MKNFEKIVVYLNFTEGAYSDYTQFRLLQNAKDKSGPPTWTKNDSIYVDYEYNDIDYFLLMEDYAVGSDDSLFEHLDYVRNGNFVTYDTLSSEYIFNKNIQMADFDNFTRKDDKRTVLEFYDSNLDGQHELVIQKEDIDVNGIYDVFKYGGINPAGEIIFHTTLIKIESTNIETDKGGNVRQTELYETNTDVPRKSGNESKAKYWAQREVTTNFTTTRTTKKTSVVVQKDLDQDGAIDREVTFEVTNIFSISVSFTTEINEIYHHIGETLVSDGVLVEYRNSTVGSSDKSHSFIFNDFVNGEVNSTRIYEDVFPNELSEKYNLNYYLETVTNDMGDEDPSNDIILQAPALESLLSLTHTTDNVPAIFDNRIQINSPAVVDNILETTKVISIPDSRTGLDKITSTLDIIEVIPDKVIIDSNPRTNPSKVSIDGKYWYYSSADNGIYDTIFVVGENDNVLAIGFEYDYNFLLEPNKKIISEKHLMSTEVEGGNDLMQITKDSRIYLRDYERYDGIFFESTFTDSLYDIWKMIYDSDTSTLMREVSAITSQQFIQSVKSRIVGDIIWQVGIQLLALVASTATDTGPLGYMLVYGVFNALKSFSDAERNRKDIASQTLLNPHYDKEITLSSKNAMDALWGGTIPNIVGFSTAGVYADVHLELDKHLFKGQLLLAPSGVKKTEWFGLSNIPLSLEYSTQKGGYVMYSDKDEPRISPYFTMPAAQEFNVILALMFPLIYPSIYAAGQVNYAKTLASKDPEILNMGNTINYLEWAISQQTDGDYDTLFPYMVYENGVFMPTFQFAKSDSSHPVPEFYRDYPILVDSAYYSQLKDEFSTIYKTFDSSSSQDLQIIPDDAAHSINSGVSHIEVYFKNTLDDEFYLGNYSADKGHYIYDDITGVLTLSDLMYATLLSVLDLSMKNHETIHDYDAYFIFEVKIAKYRSLDNLEGMTQEESERIAMMQAVDQSILEYTYHYKHSQTRQQGLSEMYYTVFVTVVSTLITVGISLGVGKLLKVLNSKKIIDLAKLTKGTTTIVDKVPVTKISPAGRLAKMFSGQLKDAKVLGVLFSPISESLQEIFVDPYLETIVTDMVVRAGGNVFWQTLISSLAESGRESFSGIFSSTTKGSKDIQASVNDKQISEQTDSTGKEAVEGVLSEKDSQTTRPTRWRSILKSGASLMLGTALLGIGGPMFFGASLAGGFSALQSIFKVFKRQKSFIQQVVDSESAEIISDLISDLDMLGVSDVMQDAARDERVSLISEESFPIRSENMVEEIFDLTRSSSLMGFSPKIFFSPNIGPSRTVPQRKYTIVKEPYPFTQVLSIFLETYSMEKNTLLSVLPRETLASLLLGNKRPSLRQQVFNFIQKLGSNPSYSQLSKAFPGVSESSL
ncbi:MAG: hypothetical protein JYX80_14440 [Candidatus Scalindua sediminis]|nr:hypothetical protein [Candidatus Scalindua sediminis]